MPHKLHPQEIRISGVTILHARTVHVIRHVRDHLLLLAALQVGETLQVALHSGPRRAHFVAEAAVEQARANLNIRDASFK